MSAAAASLAAGPAATSLRRAAGATDSAVLTRLLQEYRPTAAAVDADVDESGRSALHHACWRGSLDNVQSLLDLGCDVNAWSTGLHSYGKTPIFYAITRCRDPVVQLLLEHGARTRIMNNKGQTVLSLAASHNSPATVSAIEAAEEQEGHLDAIWEERLATLSQSDKPRVRRGGWLDFLSSHPDGVRYGDLDPRFVPADELAQLLADGGVQTRYAINPTSHESRRIKKHAPGRSWKQDDTLAQPPSRGNHAYQQRAAEEVHTNSAQPPSSREALDALLDASLRPLEALLSAAHPLNTPSGGNGPSTSSLITAADSVVAALSAYKGPWLQPAAVRIGRLGGDEYRAALKEAAAVDDSDGLEASAAASNSRNLRKRLLLAAAGAPSVEEEQVAAVRAKEERKARAAYDSAKFEAARAAEERRVVRVSGLPMVPATPPPTVWVSDLNGLMQVREALVNKPRVGVDTEWCDGETDKVSDALLATVQIGVEESPSGGRESAFVIDALVPDPEYQRVLAEMLRSLLLSGGPSQIPVGFAFAADAKKIADWLMRVEGLDEAERDRLYQAIRAATVDVQLLAVSCGVGGRSQGLAGLRQCCDHWIHQVMSKEEQCSDWAERPLRSEQLSYAALDATACLRCLAAMEDDWGAPDLDKLDRRLVWIPRAQQIS